MLTAGADFSEGADFAEPVAAIGGHEIPARPLLLAKSSLCGGAAAHQADDAPCGAPGALRVLFPGFEEIRIAAVTVRIIKSDGDLRGVEVRVPAAVVEPEPGSRIGGARRRGSICVWILYQMSNTRRS